MSDSPTHSAAPAGDATADRSVHDSTRDNNDPTATSSERATGDSLPAAPEGYELYEEVGSGGMGIVYRAREIALDRDVALKFLQGSMTADSPSARRFLDEARITSQLQHPAIPPVHHVGLLPDGRPFLAMKLIKGETLAELLAAKSVDRAQLVPVFAQVCQGVAYAHARKVIHRDLKPANVMVGAFGEVQVMDWGLAKVLTEPEVRKPTDVDDVKTQIRPLRGADAATQAGSLLGTPSYMSPEQAGGEIGKVDEQADVFGLGAMLCTILTGTPPYWGPDSDEIRLMAIRGETAGAFARLDACGVDSELVTLCKRCLAAKPDERPRDAGEVAKAVTAHLAAAEERARQAELERVRAEGERAKVEAETRELGKRRKVQLALAGVVLLFVAATGAFAWWQERQEERAKLKQAEFDSEQALTKAATERVESERRLRVDQVRWRVAADISSATVYRKTLRFADADAALNAAWAQLANGDANDLLPILTAAKAELGFVREADSIRYQASTIDPRPEVKRPEYTPRYKKAFKLYGIDPLDESATVVTVFKITTSPIRDDLLDALQNWAWESGTELGEAEANQVLPRLLQVAWLVDRTEWKARFFQFLDKADLAEGRKLMAEADVTRLTPGFVVFLAKSLEANNIDSRPLLERARAARPDNFHLNYALGRHYINWRAAKLESEKEKSVVLAYLRAAQAIRPDHPRVAQDLTVLLWLKIKDLNAALLEAERWVQLEPNYDLAQRTLAKLRQQVNSPSGGTPTAPRPHDKP